MTKLGTSKDRSELTSLLMALDGQVRDAEGAIRQVERALEHGTFGAYQAFRARIDQARALAALAEERLDRLEDPRASVIRHELGRLDQTIWQMVTRASRRFFTIVKARRMLPLCAHEIFMPELKALQDARERLSQPELADRVSAELIEEIRAAEAAVAAVIEHTRPLDDFTALAGLPPRAIRAMPSRRPPAEEATPLPAPTRSHPIWGDLPPALAAAEAEKRGFRR
ncbi:MAG: hypothetical protein GC191_21335 [Azospirillum sp.]|nr:hypothetical protein [Azospirillum sp.]